MLQGGSLQHLTAEATLAPVLSALNSVLGSARPVALHQPHFAGREWEYVKDCLDTGWVSSVGAYVTSLESDLQNYTGIANAVAVVNGTAALHVCCLLAGVTTGDEVLLPTLTFVATANAVSYCGATPHMVDVSATTLGVDADKLAAYLAEIAELRGDTCYNRITGRPLRALIVMHAFGHPVELDALAELCKRYRIALIEDAAEALGSFYHGKHVGHWGMLSAISFNGNKIVTTGGGGAVLTNDAELARRATASDDHRQASAPVGIHSRSSGLQLPSAESQCRRGLRADGAAARLCQPQTRTRDTLPAGLRRGRGTVASSVNRKTPAATTG